MNLSKDVKNQISKLVCTKLNAGYFTIYGGVQPESPEVKCTDNEPLVVLRFLLVAFKDPENGVCVSYPLKEGKVLRDGKATWYRTTTKSGEVVFDGSIGRSKLSDLTVDDTELTEGDTFKISYIEYVTKSS